MQSHASVISVTLYIYCLFLIYMFTCLKCVMLICIVYLYLM